MGANESREAQEFFVAHDLLSLSELTKTQARDAFEEVGASFPDEQNVQSMVKFLRHELRGALTKGGYLSFNAFLGLVKGSPVWEDRYRKADFISKTKSLLDDIKGSKCGWLITQRPDGGKKAKMFCRFKEESTSSAAALTLFSKLGKDPADSMRLNGSSIVSINGDNDKKFMIRTGPDALLCTAQSSPKARAWYVSCRRCHC